MDRRIATAAVTAAYIAANNNRDRPACHHHCGNIIFITLFHFNVVDG